MEQLFETGGLLAAFGGLLWLYRWQTEKFIDAIGELKDAVCALQAVVEKLFERSIK